MTPITRNEMRAALEYSLIDFSIYLVHTFGYRPGLSMLAAMIDSQLDGDEVLDELTGNLQGTYWGTGDRDLSRITLCTRSVGEHIINQRQRVPIEFVFEQVHDFVYDNRVDQCGLVFRNWLPNMRIWVSQADQFLKASSVQWQPDPNRVMASFRQALTALREMVDAAEARLRFFEGSYLTIKDLATATGLNEQTVRNLSSRKDYALTFKKVGTTSYMDAEASRPWLEVRAEFQPPQVIDSFPGLLHSAFEIIQKSCQDTGNALSDVMHQVTPELILDGLPARELEPLIFFMDVMKDRQLWRNFEPHEEGERLQWSAETYLLQHYMD